MYSWKAFEKKYWILLNCKQSKDRQAILSNLDDDLALGAMRHTLVKRSKDRGQREFVDRVNHRVGMGLVQKVDCFGQNLAIREGGEEMVTWSALEEGRDLVVSDFYAGGQEGEGCVHCVVGS